MLHEKVIRLWVPIATVTIASAVGIVSALCSPLRATPAKPDGPLNWLRTFVFLIPYVPARTG